MSAAAAAGGGGGEADGGWHQLRDLGLHDFINVYLPTPYEKSGSGWGSAAAGNEMHHRAQAIGPSLEKPPLFTGKPVYGVVFGSTVCFVHEEHLPPCVKMEIEFDKNAEKPSDLRGTKLKLWGIDVVLYMVQPPYGGINIGTYFTTRHGCKCESCIFHVNHHQDLDDYLNMGGGKKRSR